MERCHVQVQGLLLVWYVFFTVQLSVVDAHFTRKTQSCCQTKYNHIEYNFDSYYIVNPKQFIV